MEKLYLWGISPKGLSFRNRDGSVEITSILDLRPNGKTFQDVTLHIGDFTEDWINCDNDYAPCLVESTAFLDAMNANDVMVNINRAAEKWGYEISSRVCWLGGCKK